MKKSIKRLTKEERQIRNNEIISLYKKGFSVKEIALKIGMSESGIKQIIPSELKPKVHFTTKEEEDYCVKHYFTKTSGEIAKELGIKRSSVAFAWKKNGLSGKDRGRMYYCNFDYFEKIDSGEKAYWLGFIMADGNIYKRPTHQGRLKIKLWSKDMCHLENFNNSLNSNYPIYTRDKNDNPNVVLEINSDKMFNDLQNLGVQANKTWKDGVNIEKIPKKFWIDFCYGFFDGDGSVTFTSKNGIQASFCGNFFNMSQLQYMLSQLGIFTTLKRETKRQYTKDFYTLLLTNARSQYSFLKPYTSRNYKVLDRKISLANQFIYNIEYCVIRDCVSIEAVKYYKNNSYLQQFL